MSRALIRRRRWFSKPARATQPQSRAVVSTCDGSVGNLPFRDSSFDKAMAVNSMQLWPSAVAGLQEIRRVLKPGGKLGLGFTHHSGQPNKGLETVLAAAGFTDIRVVEADKGFCVFAAKPKRTSPSFYAQRTGSITRPTAYPVVVS